jgi:2-methylaconitate cis-trans-isomerase PrpF
MGGGISSLSKIVVVGPPESATGPSKVDCEYTFVQVGVEDGAIDIAGNCGNLSSMVGCFAIDEGICSARVEKNGRGRVRSWNTNTGKQIDTVFPISAGPQGGSVRPVLDREEIGMAGVPGKASRIDLEFTNPAGARTGSLLPTGRPVDVLSLPANDLTEVSLVDATNPTVILPYHEVRRIRLRAVFSHLVTISSVTHFAGFGAISRS